MDTGGKIFTEELLFGFIREVRVYPWLDRFDFFL